MMLLAPAALLAALGTLVGVHAPRRVLAASWLIAAIMAVPWFLVAAYYTHMLDVPAYFEWRAAPSTDGLATGVGFVIGLLVGVHARACRLTGVHLAAAPTLACLALTAAFAKPWLQPRTGELNDVWVDGVCIQTSPTSCGPCATATLLRHFGIVSTEAEVARVADTRLGGTLNWRLARVLRAEGLTARFRGPEELGEVSPPALIGVRLGSPRGARHFVVLLGRAGDELVVGEPLEGRLTITEAELEQRYVFDGFALEVSRE